MMDLRRCTGPAGVRLEYRSGRPRDVDGPALGADVLGRLLAADEGRPATCTVFADGYTDDLARIWPMVEAVAGRTVGVTFSSDAADAGIAVAVDIRADGATAQAVRTAGLAGFDHDETIALAEPAGASPPKVGGLDMPAWWRREEPDLIGLCGRRCPACGRIEYPAPPDSCPRCGATLEPHRLATTGTVLTWTVDRLFESRLATGMAVVDLDGGGRFYGQVADGWPTDALAAGAPVRLVPRVLHADERRTAYFWKLTTGGEGHRG